MGETTIRQPQVENLSQLVTNGDEFGQIAEGLPTTIQ